jgi:hypothetical protein
MVTSDSPHMSNVSFLPTAHAAVCRETAAAPSVPPRERL